MKNSGKVELEGSIWLARSTDDTLPSKKERKLSSEKIVGNKLIVKKKLTY